MKRSFIRFVVFVAVFMLLFAPLNIIYVPKEYLSSYAKFYNEPKDSMDIIALGASTIYNHFLPAVVYEETGVCSYNLATGASPSVIQYYWLREALKYQSPSVVIMPASYIFESGMGAEVRHRQGMDFMRWSENKLSAVMDIISNTKGQSIISYFFPIFRYHGRHDLTEADYQFSNYRGRNLSMGSGVLRNLPETEIVMPNDFWEAERDAEYDVNDKYLIKMLELCDEKKIDVVLIFPPTSEESRWSLKKSKAMMDWAEKHGCALIDFSIRELWDEVGIDEKADFANPNHLNIIGATKLSKYLATYISENYTLPDRRGEDIDPYWDEVKNNFHRQYDAFLKKIE